MLPKTKNFNPLVDLKLSCTCGEDGCDKRSTKQMLLNMLQKVRAWSATTAEFELVTWVFGLLAYPGITDLISIIKREFGFGLSRQSYFLGPATSDLIFILDIMIMIINICVFHF